jgi:hypothetical protein
VPSVAQGLAVGLHDDAIRPLEAVATKVPIDKEIAAVACVAWTMWCFYGLDYVSSCACC